MGKSVSIDLAPLSRNLEVCFRSHPPVGYADGKDTMRRVVMQMLECSVAEAQRIVDSMEAAGFIRCNGRGKYAEWQFR